MKLIKNIALALTATGIVMHIVATVMMVVQAFKVIGFSRLVMMNELGLWVELFKADISYSLTIIGMGVMAFGIQFAGKVIYQMAKEELETKSKEWYKLGK